MPAEVEALLATGRDALARGDWQEARRAFEAAVEHGEAAEAYAGLGDALWWLGETDHAVRCSERAYAAFRRRGDPAQAVLAAISLYFLYRISLGNIAASRGWLGRAARLVEDFELAPLTGWVLLVRAHDGDDPAASEEWARQALRSARRFGDIDLELCALSQAGAALVQMGRTGEGAALLDEAMAGALGGEGERLHTVVYTCCNMISSCGQAAEVERAKQWIRVADEFTRRYGSPHLYTHCRAYLGAVLYASGDWSGAEREFEAALRLGRSAEPALYAEALAGLAGLRLAQGSAEQAERLIEGFDDHAASAGVLAALRLAAGEPAAAARIARRRLGELDRRGSDRPGSYRAGVAVCLERAALLEALAEAEAEQVRTEEAVAAARRLAKLGETSGCELIAALGRRALGRALGASGDGGAARAHLEEALSLFGRLRMPYERARTRLLLARAYGADEHEAAATEARAALTGFDALGAARDADAASGLLRSLGVRAVRGRPRAQGTLTRREREVLALLAEGRSNREIAERLFLTRKTVEHHVRGVLTKLGLRSRAEAAAYAVRHLDSAPDRDR